VLDDFHIGDAHVFHHQKSGGPHDRRHELAVGGAGHLHGAGLFRGEADLFHQGDGEGARGDHVGDGGAGDQSGQAGGDHGSFGRAAAQMTKAGKSGADKVVARAGRLQQRSEEDEHENHAGGNPQGDAVDTLGGKPVVGHPFAQAGALVGDHRRHIGAEEGVDDETPATTIKGGPRARRVASSSMIRPTTETIRSIWVGLPGTVGQIGIEPEQIGRTKRGHQCHHPVLNGM
jgi:hypothetical protein